MIAGVARGIFVRWLILWALFVGTGAVVVVFDNDRANLLFQLRTPL